MGIAILALACAGLSALGYPWLRKIITSRAPLGSLNPRQRVLISRPVVVVGSISAAPLWLLDAPVPVRIGIIVAALFSWYLLCIDAAIHKLPDPLVIGAGVSIAAGIVTAFLMNNLTAQLLFQTFLGAIAGLGLFLGIALMGRKSLGFGDVKLAGVLGLLTGFLGLIPFLQWIVLSFLLGGCFAAVLLISRRMGAKDSIAFGPWMIIGAFASLALNAGAYL